LSSKSLKKLTVLLTSSGALGATSYINCLKNNYQNRKIRVVCADTVDQPIMHYKADSFHLLPKGNSKKYINSLIKLCKKEKIHVVILCSWSEVFTTSKNLDLLNSQKIFPNVPHFSIIKKMRNKFFVFKLLKENKIPVPNFYLVHNKGEFVKALDSLNYPNNPVCFKPSEYSASGGSKGFRILRKENSIKDIILNQKPGSLEIDFDTTLKIFSKKNLEMLVMEYLPGNEYSIHVLAKNGKLLYVSSFLKKRAIHGHSLESIIEEKKIFNDIAEKIVQVMNYSFNMNIQFKLSKNGKPKVIEINPRIGGGISLPVVAGINFPYLAVKMALNEKLPSQKTIRHTKLLRYWKELYVQNSKTFEYN